MPRKVLKSCLAPVLQETRMAPKSTAPFPISLALPLIVKPHPTEALLRLRSSSIATLAIVLVTSLLPLPTPIDAWRAVQSGEGGGFWWGLSSIGTSYLHFCVVKSRSLMMSSLV